ncbi:hypothetical protein [Larkinella humicola]|uniref:Dolichyl-phosphate-mannose-protein mannosyltransferase n=1 Tax=Larkinella humicola TaxID=2607654 RepID=A0A5N1JGK2_9BACT|nr:hypothetical protein [Larkinella humicola]KAA9353627.1 hypothetical protein F0P93_13385 [Larkinella humicola]
MKNRLLWPLTGIFLMIGFGLALTHNLPLRYDVTFGDEMTYLASSLTYTFPPAPYLAQWGSFYAAWLKALQAFTNDTLVLFYLNWRLLILMTGSLLFLYLYLRKSGFIVSLFCALCFQFSALNVQLDPRISAFTLCLILGGLCVVQAWEWSTRNVLLITALTALVCSYVRPEFYISMMTAVVVAIETYFPRKYRNRELTLNSFSGLLSFAVLVIAMRLLFGNPLAQGEEGTNRSFDAFVQHFSINYNTWNNRPIDIPIPDQFKLVANVFGRDVKSMSAAFFVHPDLVLRHFWTNIANTAKAEFRILSDLFFKTPLMNLSSPYRKWWLLGLLVVVVFGLLDLSGTFRRLVTKSIRLNSKELALFILLFPSMASVVLVFPRSHYLYFHAFGLIIIVAFLLGYVKLRIAQSSAWLASLASLMMIWVIYQTAQQQKELRPTPVADNIRFIQALSINGPVSSLERDWYRVFLYSQEQKPRWVPVEFYQPNTDFGRFLTEQNVNFILMTKDMQTYFAGDRGFAAFMSGGDASQFVRLEAPEPGSYLLVRPELLSKPPTVSALLGN